MAGRGKKDVLREANEVVASSLRDQAAHMTPGPQRQQLLLEALALAARYPSPEDSPSRRSTQEYTILPSDNESLRERGKAFLGEFGLGELPDQYVLVANRDDLLEITITDPQDENLFAQTTLTVTQKGEALARSVGEFLRGLEAQQYVAKPSTLQQLVESEFDLGTFIADSLETSIDTPYGIRSAYNTEATDESVGETLSGAMHTLQAAAEVCTNRHVTFAQPLMVIETNMRNRYPYNGATKGIVIITDGIPEEYENLVDIMEAADSRTIGKINRKLERLAVRIRKQLAQKRGIEIPIALLVEEVYMSKRNGRLLITGLSTNYENMENEDDAGSQDNDEGDGDISVST